MLNHLIGLISVFENIFSSNNQAIFSHNYFKQISMKNATQWKFLCFLLNTFTIFLFTFGYNVHAQKHNLQVFLTSKSPDIFIENVSLRVNGKYVGVKPDKAGRFDLQLATGKYKLVFSHVGFQIKATEFSLKADTTFKVVMELATNELDEFVVRGTSNNQNKDFSIGTLKLSVRALQRIPVFMGEFDLQRGLQTLPGVSSVGEGANGLNIRGGNVDQNLILFEGNPIYNPSHLFGIFSVVPGESIQSIDLYKGAIPVRFGGRTSSVIEIKSKEPSLDNTVIEGGVGLIASKIHLEQPIIKGKLSFLVTGRNSFLGNYLDKLYELVKYRGGFNEVFGKILYRPNESNRITLSHFYTQDNSFFKGIAFQNDGNTAQNSDINYTMSNSAFKWSNYRKKTAASTELSLTHSVYIPTLGSEGIVLTQTFDNNIERSGLRINQKRDFGTKNNVEIGAEANLNNISPGIYKENGKLVSSLPVEKSIESGLYAALENYSIQNLKLSVGLRYSYFQNLGASSYRVYKTEDRILKPEFNTFESGNNEVYNTYGGVEPRFGLNYKVNDNNSIQANYSVNRQYIQLVTNNTTPLPVSRWKVADPNIKPQISSHYTLGFYHNKNRFNWSAEGYYKENQNYLDVVQGSNFLLKDNVETDLIQGKNKAYGIELASEIRFGKLSKSILSVNYTFSRSFNQFTGVNYLTSINNGEWYRSNFDRPHTFNVNIKIQESPIHHFAFAFTYSSGRPFTGPSTYAEIGLVSYPVYYSRNNFTIPSYHRLDFSWIIDNPSRKTGRYKGSWQFNLYNLYGRENIYSIFFENKNGQANAKALSVIPNIIPSLTYTFMFK
jgi:outer membrane receptor protein involved in Fe transport